MEYSENSFMVGVTICSSNNMRNCTQGLQQLCSLKTTSLNKNILKVKRTNHCVVSFDMSSRCSDRHSQSQSDNGRCNFNALIDRERVYLLG